MTVNSKEENSQDFSPDYAKNSASGEMLATGIYEYIPAAFLILSSEFLL